MIVVETVTHLREHMQSWRRQGENLVFVPTMGNLHAGHLSLVRAARQYGRRVVVSIYVNPMQFDRSNDFNDYPRTRAEDQEALQAEAVDLLFVPSDEEMYPRPLEEMSFVDVPDLGAILEGQFRPGHFRGVATVVARLFNLVQPDIALFGKKDFQQLRIIERVVADLGMPVKIIGIDTVREPDGLAMSSRNVYLSAEERKKAPRLYATLQTCRGLMQQDRQTLLEIEQQARKTLEDEGFKPDYVSIRRQTDLAKPTETDSALVILVSAWLGKTRLIDNLEVSLNRDD